MKLIILYGPPGVGKLTIGTKLAKLSGFKLFHNHLAVDLAVSLFPFATAEFAELSCAIRIKALDVASKSELVPGIVMSLVYGVETLEGKKDDWFVKQIIKTVEKNGGEVYFVRLYCSDTVLYQRVVDISRTKFKKLRNIKVLKTIRKNYRVDARIPSVESLEINTTKKSASVAAKEIFKYVL